MYQDYFGFREPSFPALSPVELLQEVCREFGLPSTSTETRELHQDGVLRRVGLDKSGYWEVVQGE